MSLRVAYVDQTEYIENQGAVLGISGHGYVLNTPIGSDLKLSERLKMRWTLCSMDTRLFAVLVGHAPSIVQIVGSWAYSHSRNY